MMSAFLNEELEDEVYMKQPEECKLQVWKLIRSLYEIKYAEIVLQYN